MTYINALPAGLAFTAGLVISSTTMSQTSLTFVKDINTTPIPVVSGSSNPTPARSSTGENDQQWAMMGGWMYFRAKTDAKGYELFKSDGSKAVLVKDIYVGSTGSYPAYFTVAGNKVFFRAGSAGTGTELWVTDGTSLGTKLVKDIRPGSLSSFPNNFASLGNRVCFAANDGVKGSELWVSDGTPAGTKMLKDIGGGSSSSSPLQLKSDRAGKKLFFSAYGSNGRELWVTDGTSAGTKLVKDIRLGRSSSSPSYFQQLGTGKVVFQATDLTRGTELWVSDGTPGGTNLVKDVYAGSLSGTSLFASSSLGSKVLFTGRTKAEGSEAWITDGTPSGTFLLKDVTPGAGSGNLFSSDVDAGKAWWGCSASRGTYEIWVTDGTLAGTRRFSKTAMSRRRPYNIAASKGKVFFCAFDVVANTGFELCMTDGTTTTTVKDIRAGRMSGLWSTANYCSTIGPGVVAFSADDGKTGSELWISKGTAATTMLIDINKPIGPAPTGDDRVSDIESLFGKVIFSATDGTDKAKGQRGQELWISDGSSKGTKILKDIFQRKASKAAGGSSPRNLCRLGNFVYFSADDGSYGRELWRTDGTTAGTRLFKDIRPGRASSYPSELTRIKDKIYFRASDGVRGSELWVTDGTAAGTRMVRDIHVGRSSSSPSYFARLGLTDKCVFRAYVGDKGREVWITDGTLAGTKIVKDILGGSQSSFPSFMRSWGDRVYFEAYTPSTGYELWVTDGTFAGTNMVKDLGSGTSSGYAKYIEVQNNKLYFYGWSATTGIELYCSDGTASGTGLYMDLVKGPASTWPSYLTAVGSRRLYFRSTDAGSGTEPGYIDVSTDQVMRWDANPAGNSSPYNYAGGAWRFAVDGGSVYMRATPTTLSDQRLVRIANGATAQPIGRIQGSSFMTATDPRLGKNMVLTGKTSLENPVSLVFLGFDDMRPKSQAGYAPGSYAYFDLTKPFFIVGGIMTGKTWTLAAPVPARAPLLGSRAVLQAWSFDTRAFPNGVEVSNGIHLTIGR